eukprot:1153863-Pelagomonas_calceolata.AAC.2
MPNTAKDPGPPSPAAATAAATWQKRWEARGGGGRATSEDRDTCFRAQEESQAMKAPWGPSVRYGDLEVFKSMI